VSGSVAEVQALADHILELLGAPPRRPARGALLGRPGAALRGSHRPQARAEQRDPDVRRARAAMTRDETKTPEQLRAEIAYYEHELMNS
jgi:hypothetical protein